MHDDDDRQRVRRVAVDANQPHEVRTAVDRRETDAGHDERAERHDERDVRDALAGIEVTLVPREAAGDRTDRQAATWAMWPL